MTQKEATEQSRQNDLVCLGKPAGWVARVLRAIAQPGDEVNTEEF